MSSFAMRNAIRTSAAAVILVSCLAGAQTKFTPLDLYRETTQGRLLLCSASFKSAILTSQLIAKGVTPPAGGIDWATCVASGREDAGPLLAEALKTINKPAAAEALKTYHVAFISALNGISPGDDEVRFAYATRQRALQDRVGEAWTRFEIER